MDGGPAHGHAGVYRHLNLIEREGRPQRRLIQSIGEGVDLIVELCIGERADLIEVDLKAIPNKKPAGVAVGYKRDGQVIAAMAPVHIMVSSGKRPMPGVILEVDTEDKALAAEPDGYLHVMWPKVDELRMPTAQTRTRLIVGWIAMVGVVALFGWLAFSAPGWRRKGWMPNVVRWFRPSPELPTRRHNQILEPLDCGDVWLTGPRLRSQD